MNINQSVPQISGMNKRQTQGRGVYEDEGSETSP